MLVAVPKGFRRDMTALAIVSRAAAVCLATTGFSARAGDVEPPHAAAAKTVCLGPAETREQVKAHKLIEPYAALKSAAQVRKAEALSAKLCTSGDDFVYVITVLHHDGRLAQVQVDAGSGKLVQHPGAHEQAAKDAHEAPAKDAHEPPETHEQPVKN
jgi:hypothetical protein